MPRALNPKATFTYVLEADRDLPDGHPYKTVFTLRGLTIDEEEQVANKLFGGKMGTDEISLNSGSHGRAILDLGLEGWDNFNAFPEDWTPPEETDEEKNGPDAWEDKTIWPKQEIRFAKTRATNGRIKPELLDRIESTDRTELANAITARGKLTSKEGNV